jgi:hypothetical protein
MAEILGLGLSDFPPARFGNEQFCSQLKKSFEAGTLPPEMMDPKNWPPEMQAEWGDDKAETHAGKMREYLAEQWGKLKTALDDFKPDFILMWSKDHNEALKHYVLPQYWIQAHDEVTIQPYKNFARRNNIWGVDPDTDVVIKGHPAGAKHLIRGLQDAGFDPTYSTEPMYQDGLAHTFIAAITHLDWEKREFKTPVVPVSIDPFGPRARKPEGMSPISPETPLPLSPKRAFELGRHTARILKASPWRVALVAAVGWSHTQDTSWENHWIHPDQEADIRRYEEFKNNKFEDWGDSWTVEEFEAHGQWELTCWIALAGAMTELGAKVQHSDLKLQWTPPSEWVHAIFNAV